MTHPPVPGRIFDCSPHISVDDFETRWRETSALYRRWLYQDGAADPAIGEPGRKGFSREEVEKESARSGQVSLAEKLRCLRCRVRYLTDGVVFGSAAFVDQIFATNREHFGKRRTSKARQMRSGIWGELRVLRDLQSK